MVEAQEKEVQVVVISGDGGQYAKTFEYQSEAGVQFLMSGINSLDTVICPSCKDKGFNLNPDSVLLLNYDLKDKELEWEFKDLKELGDN